MSQKFCLTLKFVAGNVAIGMAIGGLIGYITGGGSGLKQGLLDGAVDGFMWGGIAAAVSAAIVAIKAIRAVKAGKALKYTKHGLDQILGRDGGRGVSDAAIRNTLKNPKKVKPQSNGAVRFEGSQSVVALNKAGEIITACAKSSKYFR